MRSTEEREQVVALLASGLNDCVISRRTGIPRSTIRDWRTQPEPKARQPAPVTLAEIPAAPYAYLLGIYLGDAYLAPPTRANRRSRQLRIHLDNLYPAIILECANAIEALFPGRRARIRLHATDQMVIVSLYSDRWELLLPQHGPGMKHTRHIDLVQWQRKIVEREPGRFLRGLIHSDGWRGQNRVRSETGKRYVYPRYEFSNRSDDIRRLFTWACDLLGVAWRERDHMTVSVARRDSVALLDEFVGPKRYRAAASSIRARVSSSTVAKKPPTTSSSWPIESAQ